MARQVPLINEDDKLVVGDIEIADAENVESVTQTETASGSGRSTYVVKERDGTTKTVKIMGTQTGSATGDNVYTKAEVDALLENVTVHVTGISFDPSTREIIIETE